MKRILVSDQTINSYGFNVLTAGIDLGRFEGNPIMLFNHVRAIEGKTDDVLPIGTWKDLTVEGDKLFATPVFDETDEFAQRIAKKFEAGVLRSASIGISIQKMLVDDEADTLSVTESQLREISIVDIPSNQNAVAFYDEQNEPMSEEAVLALAAGLSPSKPTIQPEMKFDKTIALLGLSADAGDAAVADAIKNLQLERNDAVAKVEAFEAGEAERVKTANLAVVDQAITDRKITEGQKDQYVKLMNADAETTTALLKDMTPAPKLKDIPKGGGEGGTSELKFEGKTFDQLHREEGGLAKLKAGNFELFKEMYEAEYGKEYTA